MVTGHSGDETLVPRVKRRSKPTSFKVPCDAGGSGRRRGDQGISMAQPSAETSTGPEARTPPFCWSSHLETHNLGSEHPGPTHVSGRSPALASVYPPKMVVVGLQIYTSYPPTCWPMPRTSSGTSLGFRTLGGWMCHPPASPAKQPRRQVQIAQGPCTPVTPVSLWLPLSGSGEPFQKVSKLVPGPPKHELHTRFYPDSKPLLVGPLEAPSADLGGEGHGCPGRWQLRQKEAVGVI